MPILCKHSENGLICGIWKMDDAPDLSKRERELIAVNSLMAELCNETKTIQHQESGKPFLEDESYHISISHTKGYAAVALHPFKEVGIDIEQYGDKVCRVRNKFLQPEEEKQVDKDDIYKLLLYWSAKETVFKVLGLEGVELKQHIRIFPFVSAEQGTFHAMELKTGTNNQFLIKYLIHKDFVLTYTV